LLLLLLLLSCITGGHCQLGHAVPRGVKPWHTHTQHLTLLRLLLLLLLLLLLWLLVMVLCCIAV
jgi:hypothetical protein